MAWLSPAELAIDGASPPLAEKDGEKGQCVVTTSLQSVGKVSLVCSAWAHHNTRHIGNGFLAENEITTWSHYGLEPFSVPQRVGKSCRC